MIIKKMDIRPGSAVQSRMNASPECVTIVSKFYDYSKERNISHRNVSQAVLPTFSQLPVKSLTRLLYDRFAVKGLDINKKSSPKKVSVCNRAQRKQPEIYIRDTIDSQPKITREQKSSIDYSSFFRDSSTKRTFTRPVTAKRPQSKQADQRRNRPVTASKNSSRPLRFSTKSVQKLTRVTTSLSTSVLVRDKLIPTVYQKTANETPKVQNKPRIRSPIQSIEETKKTDFILFDLENDKDQTDAVLKQAQVKNQKHLEYMQNYQSQLYNKFMESQKEGVPLQERELVQTNNEIYKEDTSEGLDYYNDLTIKINSVQQKVEDILKFRICNSTTKTNEKEAEVLSLEQFEQLIQLFKNRQKNKQALDLLIKKIRCFTILTQERRQRIIQLSEVAIAEEEQQIIRKGDEANFIYVIIKGSVEKQEQQTICKVPLIMTKSLFDGEVFGIVDDRQHTGERKVCEYSIVAKEKSTFLKIPYQEYMSIQSDFLKSQLSVKIEALIKLPCFEEMKPKDLMPLATLLQDERYNNGDVILREGEETNKFLIMTKGCATVVKEQVVVRKKNRDSSSFARQAFSCHNAMNSLHQPVQRKKSEKYISSAEALNRCNRRYKLVAEDENKLAYYYYHDFKDIRKGQQIVYRAILHGLHYQDSQKPENSKLKLSLISNSNNCEFLSLSSNHISRVPDYLLKPLVKYCRQNVDFDQFYNGQQDKKLREWDKYKADLCDEIIRNKTRVRI